MNASVPAFCITRGHHVSMGPRRIPQPHPRLPEAPRASAAAEYARRMPNQSAIGIGESHRSDFVQTSEIDAIATAISATGTLRFATPCQKSGRIPCSRSADAKSSGAANLSRPSTSIAAAISTTPASEKLCKLRFIFRTVAESKTRTPRRRRPRLLPAMNARPRPPNLWRALPSLRFRAEMHVPSDPPVSRFHSDSTGASR